MVIPRFIVISLVLNLVGVSWAYDWSTNPGDGTEANPYQISEPNELIAINDISTNGKYFVLTNDIDLDPNLPGRVFNEAIIGTMDGAFDGGHYEVRNYKIAAEPAGQLLGLFGTIGSEGSVQHLTVSNYIIILNMSVYRVGGVCGRNMGVIIDCHANGYIGSAIQGAWEGMIVGGFVGVNGDDKSKDCRGFIGNSSAEFHIEGVGSEVGGFAGYNIGSIYQCFSQGELSSGFYATSFVGGNKGTIQTCFSKSIFIDIMDSASGFARNSGIIKNCYSFCEFTTDSRYEKRFAFAEKGWQASSRAENCYSVCLNEDVDYPFGGGVALSNCFVEVKTIEPFNYSDMDGLYADQMKDASTYIKAGWDFVGETENGCEDIWQVDPTINDGYPSLVMKPIDGGNGTAGNPYVIYTKQQLVDFFNDPELWDKHIKMIANIDVSDVVLDEIPVTMFNGVFDGSGCSIVGLTGRALIETIGRDGVVKNLYFRSASVEGESGIIACENDGMINDCHVEGVIKGCTCGGLVAYNLGEIFRCSANCSITGSLYAGGLVAENSFQGLIRESCSYGGVGGNNYNGGLAANNYGKIEHCYSTASVDSNCAGALVCFNDFGAIICCYSTGSPENLVYYGGVVAHSYHGAVTFPEAWEGNSWYEEDGHIWMFDPESTTDYYYYPSLKWQRWGTPLTLENLCISPAPYYRTVSDADGSPEHPYGFGPELRYYPADWDKCFVMSEYAADYFSGRTYQEPVVPYFNGTLDGQGQVIENLVLTDNDELRSMGFFGILGPDAHIKQLGIENELSYTSSDALMAVLNWGTIEECYAQGSVRSSMNRGVLTSFNAGTIRSCYAKGDLTLEYIPYSLESPFVCGGGLYGTNFGRVINSYSDVEVHHIADAPICSGVGGLNEGLVWNSFWNNDRTDPDFILGGKPLTTEQLQDGSSFVGWGDDIWKIADGNDMPRLAWEHTDWYWTPENPEPPACWPDQCIYTPIVDTPRTYSGGEGTEQSPYLLETAEDLLTLGQYVADCDKYFELTNDIDFSGQTLIESVVGYFTGVFRGNGHQITNLEINALIDSNPDGFNIHSGIGLFGSIGQGGIVENLGIQNANMRGRGNVGCLAGENNGTIRRCFATGDIAAWGTAGGLTGTNGYRFIYGSSKIQDCFTQVNVYVDGFLEDHWRKFLGGVSGVNSGLIERCYEIGSIMLDSSLPWYYYFDANPIAGRNDGSFRNCYPGDGDVFSRWDMVGDDNGNRDIWRMCVDGVGYPRLSWEYSKDGDFACGDGVGLDDLVALGENWLTDAVSNPDEFNTACDANFDERINLQDFVVLSSNWFSE